MSDVSSFTLKLLDMLETDPPDLFFEITDLLNSFTRSKTPTGIQRVQIEIFKASLQMRDKIAIHICTYSPTLRGWIEINDSKLSQLIDLAGKQAGPADITWKVTLENFFMSLQERPRCTFSPNSVLVNLGTSWAFTDYMADLDIAKSQSGIKYVPFVYDLIPVILPETVDEWVEPVFKRWLHDASVRADCFAVISNSTAYDLKQILFGTFALKIEPIIMRLDGDFQTTENLNQDGRDKKNMTIPSEPYVLFVSTLERRKNHLFAFKAWQELIKLHGVDRIPLLICVGKQAWKFEQAKNFYDENPILHGKVFILSGLSDQEIAALYIGCLFTVFTSSYEGWGLPVSESLRFRKACLTADNSSLREAGREFADYYQTNSIDDFIAAFSQLLFDHAYRASREKFISEAYEPRTWIDILTEFVCDIHNMVQTLKIAK